MRSGKLISLIFGACALLTASLMFLMMEIAERSLAANSERTSSAWADFISSRLADIEGTVSGGRLTGADRVFLDDMRQFGDVFRFKLFDQNGRLVFVSNNFDSRFVDIDCPSLVSNLRLPDEIASARRRIATC